jgi:hypothetical protein
MNVAVEHSVKIKDFNDWLRRDGRTPREQIQRSRIREVLGLDGSGSK